MKDNFLIINNFKAGWIDGEDPSRIPLGALQTSVNMTLTDRGGLSPRKGEQLLGTISADTSGVRSMHSFKKTDGNDVLIKSYDDELEYYNNGYTDWARLNNGYTANKVFGYKEHQLDSDVTDLLYFCNSYEPYSRWTGYETQLNGALTGAETEVIVDSVLTSDVHYSGTASACSTTTIDIASTDWATDIWNTYFYVKITNGAKDTFISPITDTTGTRITFTAISGLSGTPTFEIRQLAVPATGTLQYNGSTVAYTGVPQSDRFTVASAHAAPDNAPLTILPTEYPLDPRGNILETSVAQMYVAGVMKAKSTVFRSALTDATDFSFESPRAANEGDIIYFPYDGGSINDIKSQEDTLYILKKNSVESLTYTQDANDLAQITPIKKGTNAGTEGRAWRNEDDIVFCTPDNKITSIGRILSKDTRPQSNDLAYDIRRAVKDYNFDDAVGIEFNNRVYVAVKSDNNVTYNDRIIVFNKDFRVWEGFWLIPASAFAVHKNKLYYGESYAPNVYEMNKLINKTAGSNSYPMTARCKTGFMSLKGNGFSLMEVSSLAVEGYITSGTTINFSLYKDFANTPFQQLSIAGSETEYQDNVPVFTVLGGDPLGMEPLGAPAVLGDIDNEGRRHFIVYLHFPITQAEYVALGVSSEGLNQDYEIISAGLNATENVFNSMNRNKN